MCSTVAVEQYGGGTPSARIRCAIQIRHTVSTQMAHYQYGHRCAVRRTACSIDDQSHHQYGGGTSSVRT